MIKIKKYFGRGLLLIILVIPVFFGVFSDYLYINELNILIITTFVLGLLLFLILDQIIVVAGFNEQNAEVIKEQDVINAFLTKKNKEIIWIFFPMIMATEELIFRFYLIGFLLIYFDINAIHAIIISSIIFSLYHLHIWFRYKNLRILLINLGYSFLLGLYNGYIFLTLGLISCILIHFTLVLILYYGIYTRYFKGNLNSQKKKRNY